MTRSRGWPVLKDRAAFPASMIARCRVLRSWAETPTTHVIQVAKPKGFAYAPVQFCGLELETPEGGIEYSMSLASSPTQPFLEFGARVASGSPWKRAFAALKEGDEVEIDGAYGHFILDEARDAVLVAGGIGITPLKGMATYAAHQKLPIQVRLLYSNRTPEEIAYRKELDALAAANAQFRIVHTVTRPQESKAPWKGHVGRIDAAMLREAAEGLRDPVYYLCGLPEMVGDLARELGKLRVPAGRVRYEQFWGYE